MADTSTKKAIEYGSLTLIVVSLLSVSIETLPNLSENALQGFFVLEIVITALFVIEYIWRVVNSEHKWRFVFSFYGIIDLLAIIPIFLLFAVDLRPLRIFRLFSLLRILRLGRHLNALSTFATALKRSKEQLLVFFTVALFFLYLSAIGIYHFEHEVQPDKFQSVFHCLWWSITTLTTVGYGDMVPLTLGGRIFAALVVFIGIGIVAAPTGIIAAALTSLDSDEDANASSRPNA